MSAACLKALDFFILSLQEAFYPYSAGAEKNVFPKQKFLEINIPTLQFYFFFHSATHSRKCSWQWISIFQIAPTVVITSFYKRETEVIKKLWNYFKARKGRILCQSQDGKVLDSQSSSLELGVLSETGILCRCYIKCEWNKALSNLCQPFSYKPTKMLQSKNSYATTDNLYCAYIPAINLYQFIWGKSSLGLSRG